MREYRVSIEWENLAEGQKKVIFKEIMDKNIPHLMKDTHSQTQESQAWQTETKNIEDKENMLKLSERKGRLPTE